MNALSREQIKSRLIKNASRIWGYTETEAESAFDPIVSLLLGACSAELERISDEIQASQARILERIAQLLTPDSVTGPQPAHGILHAIPNEPKLQVGRQHVFMFKKQTESAIPGRMETKELMFTPAVKQNVFKGRIAYMATKYQLFKYTDNVQKEVLTENRLSADAHSPYLWLGLEINEKVSNLNGLSFYFDYRAEANRTSFYHALAFTNWTIENDFPIQMRDGFQEEDQSAYSVLQHENAINSKLENIISGIYKNKFLYVKEHGPISLKGVQQLYPQTFLEFFPQVALQKLQTPCVWIKIQFPTALPSSILADLFCTINAFPIVNKRLVELTYRLNEHLNVIPLSGEDQFLDLDKIYSLNQQVFESEDSLDPGTFQSGQYTVRRGGVGRFDARDAQEILSYVNDLLRDESASFAVLGNEFLSSTLKQLNQLLSVLNQRTASDSKRMSNSTYLMIRPHAANEHIVLRYWTTSGTLANAIRVGSSFTLYSGADLQSDSLVLLTNTYGGKEKLSANESLFAYKKALLSRNKIVTTQDIIAACHAELGFSLHKVEVNRSYQTALDKKSGIQTIMKVLLHLQPETVQNQDCHEIAHELEVKLTQQSTSLIPYKVEWIKRA